MADYIYLLQNRLTPAQRRALEAVREAARSRGMPVFLVGGAVRDLSSGAPVRDLDFSVQGDASELLDTLTGGGAAVAGRNPVMSSVYLIFPGGVRVEVAPAQTVTFPKPGHPEVQPAAILDDLRRRDFTADAMAISLNEGSYGLLLDPLNGIADMENRELRLVSNYGFIEQPALLLRAARLSHRLGWGLEERTRARYETAKEEGYINSLSAFDRGYELEEIFHEDDPLATLEHLTEEGWANALYPAWTASKADGEGLERARDFIGQMEQMGIFVDPSPVFFPLLTAKLSGKDVAAIKAMFPRQGFVQQIDSLDARSKDLANQLTLKNAAPSETWKLLFAAEPEIVLWLAFHSRSGAVQAKFKSFLTEWPQARQRLPYALMQEMRITADLPGYNDLLEQLFFAQIDGKLGTPEATRAFLEPYSPPAPVLQTTPRRRPAKSARGRGRKAVEVVEEVTASEPDEAAEEFPGLAEVLSDTEPPASADDADAPESETSTPATKKKSAGKKSAAPAVPAAPAKSAPEKKTSAEKAPAKVTAKAPEKHADVHKAAAKKAPAKAEKKSAHSASKTAPAAKKSAGAAKKAAVPAKSNGKGSAAAKKSSAKAAPARPAKAAPKHGASKSARPAAKKVAAKKNAAPARKVVAPAKRPAAAKKGHAAAKAKRR